MGFILRKIKQSILTCKKYFYRNHFELYDELKYIYHENRFQLVEEKNMYAYVLKYKNIFFEKSKFSNLINMSRSIVYLPYEFNSKCPFLGLQTNEYVNVEYYKAGHSFKDYFIESGLDIKNDSGKKISIMIFIFSNSTQVINFYLLA